MLAPFATRGAVPAGPAVSSRALAEPPTPAKDGLAGPGGHALLKSIEEPPDYVVVILVTSLPHMLLPTVRSRCQLVPFGHLRSDEIAQALVAEGVAEESARAAARAAAGSLERARDLASGGAG